MQKSIYYIGLVMSLGLWAVSIWALTVTDKLLIHQLILAVGGITFLAHIGEVFYLITNKRLKTHAKPKDILLTLVMGAFHLMPLIKSVKK